MTTHGIRYRHHRLLADLAVRAAGAGALAVAILAFLALGRLYGPAGRTPPDVADFALATVSFLTASAGCASLMLGHHVFDRVTIGQRWRRHR